MNAQELREKNISELETELEKSMREQLKLNIHKASGELSKSHLVKDVRRNIARIKTILNEKKTRG